MQDDLGYAALSAEVGSVVRNTIPVILEQYGIQVSMDKRAEDEAVVEGPQPNRRMLYIGADFYCNEVERPMHRGQDKSIKRFEDTVLEWDRFPRDDSCRLNCFKQPSAWACFTDAFSTEHDDTSTVAFAACVAGMGCAVLCHGIGSVT